jgi:hypothetical protein
MAVAAGGVFSNPELELQLQTDSGAVIREYLTLMEESETPRMYLVWTLIAAAAALSGKNAKFAAGPNHTVSANLFVVLLGPPAVRKTTAIRMIEKLLESTSINFGPVDTGGQRHGLMSALTGLNRPYFRQTKRHVETPLVKAMTMPRSASDMMLVAPELGRLFGSGTRDMADFMVDLYDGAKIDYETKAGNTEIRSPLVTLLGATTPSSLASMIPDNAGTHGVLSRMVFVFQDQPYKKVPIPPDEDILFQDRRNAIVQRFHWIDDNRADFVLDSNARQFFETHYEYHPLLEDPRLEYYRERRANILQRVAMALCALRSDTCIIESDFSLAHEFLKAVEPKMHRALEYFGKNKVFVGRMLVLNYLRAQPQKMAKHAELVAAAASELRPNEAEEAIQQLIDSGEIIDWGGTLALGEIKNDIMEAKARKNRTTPTDGRNRTAK